jgi:hypothetical protein
VGRVHRNVDARRSGHKVVRPGGGAVTLDGTDPSGRTVSVTIPSFTAPGTDDWTTDMPRYGVRTSIGNGAVCVDRGLVSDAEYTYTVAAAAAAGEGSESAAVTVRIPSAELVQSDEYLRWGAAPPRWRGPSPAVRRSSSPPSQASA